VRRRPRFPGAAEGLVALAVTLTTKAAWSQSPSEPTRRWEIGLAAGYSAPVGAVESGAHLGDSTIAALPIRLDAGFAATRVLTVAVASSWGPTLPTLCASADDCIHSLGTRTSFSVRARLRLAAKGRWTASGALGPGWEWFTSRLSDRGIVSRRTYDGPLIEGEVDLARRVFDRWSFGLALSGVAGVSVARELEAPGIRRRDAVGTHALHAWIGPALRTAVSF
jgi:hypothetical protein